MGAGTGWATVRDDALGVEAADDSIAHGGALALRVFLVADLAATPGCMVLRDANSILTARQGGAGVDAG